MNIGMWVFTGLEIAVVLLWAFMCYGEWTDPAHEGGMALFAYTVVGIIATIVCLIGFLISWLL